MLTRLGMLTSGKGGVNNGLAGKRVADVRAEALGPTIRKLRKAGFVSIHAIARELNERGIPAARGGKWHLTPLPDCWSAWKGWSFRPVVAVDE
jgi:hypothetical protein